MTLKPMTEKIRNQIKMYKKNGIDVSDLIKDYIIAGEDLSFCVIKNFNREEKNLKGINLAGAIIGDGSKSVVRICDKDLRGSSFNGTKFLNTTFLRRCKLQKCDFREADLSKVQYQGSDASGSEFCECILRLGTSYALGSKVSLDIFKDLADVWGFKLIEVEEYNKLKKKMEDGR